MQQTIFSEFSFQLLLNHSILSHTPAGHTYKNKILNLDNIKHSLLLFPFPFEYYKKVKIASNISKNKFSETLQVFHEITKPKVSEGDPPEKQ